MLEYAYLQNNNEIIVQLQKNNVAEDISAATKISIEFFAGKDDRMLGTAPVQEFNSVVNPTLFDVTDLANGNITFKPGPSDTGLAAAEYFTRWVIYSPNFTDGLIWGNNLVKYIVSR